MKNTDPLMGAKLKSKAHLPNTFFDFLSRFKRVWLQSLKKVLIWPLKKKLSEKIEKGVKKRRISR
jgi:ubiquinone biosynthesis protein COQ9